MESGENFSPKSLLFKLSPFCPALSTSLSTARGVGPLYMNQSFSPCDAPIFPQPVHNFCNPEKSGCKTVDADGEKAPRVGGLRCIILSWRPLSRRVRYPHRYPRLIHIVLHRVVWGADSGKRDGHLESGDADKEKRCAARGCCGAPSYG